MTFQDIFKSSFLENIASISMLDMAIALVLAFLLGLFIFFVYKKSYSGVMYSASFGVTLVALSLITTLLIMTVVSNICLLYTSLPLAANSEAVAESLAAGWRKRWDLPITIRKSSAKLQNGPHCPNSMWRRL